jgi:hypothetical protein
VGLAARRDTSRRRSSPRPRERYPAAIATCYRHRGKQRDERPARRPFTPGEFGCNCDRRLGRVDRWLYPYYSSAVGSCCFEHLILSAIIP